MGNYFNNNNNTNTSTSSALTSLCSYYLCCQHNQPVHPLNNETNLSNTTTPPISSLLTQKLSQLGTFYETVDISNELPQIIKQNLHLHSTTLNTNNTNTFTSKPIQFKNGNIYDGTWNEDIEMEGNGKLFLKEENIYIEGLWKGGNIKEGRIYFPNGDIYEGSLEQSLFEGKGTLYYISKMVQYIKETSLKDNALVMVFSYIQMVQSMLVNLKMGCFMEKENSRGVVVLFIQESLSTRNHKAMV